MTLGVAAKRAARQRRLAGKTSKIAIQLLVRMSAKSAKKIAPFTRISTAWCITKRVLKHRHTCATPLMKLTTMHLINEHLKEFQPDIINYHNLWIVKPGAKSRGRGIAVQSRILEILRAYVGTGEPNLQKDGRWVIQKYIERPLLISETKFDIRQWFMIDSFSPLKIWTYRDSYLRFCTKKFSLIDLNQAIHLCNYSIQKNYDEAVDSDRTQDLPEDNMWTNGQFDSWYYERFDVASIWESEVYPQMISIMEKVMLSALEGGNMENAGKMKAGFELYGADFMLTVSAEGKPKVWLIELNSSPTMALSSSSATHKLCRKVQEDTVELVLFDSRQVVEIGSQFGGYELTYCGHYSQKIPTYNGQSISLEAKAIKKPREPRKPRLFRLPGENFRRSIDGRKVEACGDIKENSPERDAEAKLKAPDNLEESNLEETSSKAFARRLALRKVSAIRSNEHVASPHDSDCETVPPPQTSKSTESMKESVKRKQEDTMAFIKSVRTINAVRKSKYREKILPKIEKPLVAGREVTINEDAKHNGTPPPEKKHYIRKLPARRTPMAVAVCMSQHDLSTVKRGAKATDRTHRTRGLLGERSKTTAANPVGTDTTKILVGTKNNHDAMERLASMPFLLKSSPQLTQQFTTSVSPQLSPSAPLPAQPSRSQVSQSGPDFNYSLHVNGERQKRMKTYVIDPRKFLERTMSDPTRFPVSRSGMCSKIPIATAGELPTRRQKQISVLDMSSCLHTKQTLSVKSPANMSRSRKVKRQTGKSVPALAIPSSNYKNFGIAKAANRLGADYWTNPQ